MQGTSDRIRRQLVRFNIRTVHIPGKKNEHLLRLVKDTLGLKVPGMYYIPCECSKVWYMWGRQTRCKENEGMNACTNQTSRWWPNIAVMNVTISTLRTSWHWAEVWATWIA
jgi:hypothetical protein